jgi:hypothetical protein
VSQAKDIHDFARINVEFAQKALKMAGEQAEDFTEACAGWQSSLDFVPHNYWHESRAELRGFAGRISINCLNGSEPSDRARAISLT